VRQLTLACEDILNQLESLLTGVTQEDYFRPSPALGGSSIGQHVRHTLEFFVCLEEGFHDGVLNYDRRAHDRSLETDRSLAIASIARTRDFLNHVALNKSLTLEAGYLRDSDASCSIPTTYNRELAYTIEHAVHHMAIIKIGLREVAPYVRIEAHFGIAASTVRYKETVIAQAG
jgi:uncharacterized damage-inducible protein DinB